MDAIKPVRVTFKLGNHEIDEYIEQSWSIGKIKGKVRKLFQLNPYYTLQLIYQGQVLETSQKFRDINYVEDTAIKVMASRASGASTFDGRCNVMRA